MLKKHPKGLMVLFFTEMWERFGFYTIMALFVLYMNDSFGWSDKIKGLHYGIFNGAVYVFPILGGYVADKFLGYKKTIVLGAITMGIGYSFLAMSSLEKLFMFYLALVVIAVGNGFFKANISVLLGRLYEKGSDLKDVGYNIFYMGINIGALAAPMAAAYLRHTFSFQTAFAAAAVGMVFALIIFEIGKKSYMNANNINTSREEGQNRMKEVEDIPKSESRQRIIALSILLAIAFFFWMAFYQNASALTLFAKRSVKHFKLLTPEVYQSFNPLFILLLTPVIVGLFNHLRKKDKEPTTPVKICIGMFVAALAMIVMAIASLMGGNQDVNIMSPSWLIITYLIITVSELLISPMGLSYTSKVAPPKLQGAMMGFWFGATGLGATASGIFAGFYSSMPHHIFFIVLAICLSLAGFMVMAFLNKLQKFGND